MFFTSDDAMQQIRVETLEDLFTWTAEFMFLDLGYIKSSYRSRSAALREQTDGGPLAQPLRQPGQITVADQGVGM